MNIGKQTDLIVIVVISVVVVGTYLLFLGDTLTAETFSGLAADAATVIAVIVAIYFAIREIDRWHADRSLENALRLEERFHSAVMRQSRAHVAGALKDMHDRPTSENEEDRKTAKIAALQGVREDTSILFNFFELLGHMVKQGVVDKELAYYLFSQWFIPYWKAAGEAIKAGHYGLGEDAEALFNIFWKIRANRKDKILEEPHFLTTECDYDFGGGFVYHIVSMRPDKDAADTPGQTRFRSPSLDIDPTNTAEGLQLYFPKEKMLELMRPLPALFRGPSPVPSPVPYIGPFPDPSLVPPVDGPGDGKPLPTEVTPEKMRDVASALGQAGWELVAVLPQGEGALWVFKRACT